MWILLFLIASPANAVDILVDVPGVGNVPLKDASATCLSGRSVGGVAVAIGNTRFPVFQRVAQGLAGTSTETRTTYFKYNGSLDWPQDDLQHLYTPQTLPWVPIGVIGSCYAVGKHWIDVGVEAAQACEPKGCKDLEIPTDPRPFLVRACKFPETASKEGRFIDENGLLAARWSCLQQMVILQQTELKDFEDLNRCETPWTQIEGDVDHVTVYPASDLGLAETDRTNQLKSATDALKKMDPYPGTCGSGWAATWRKTLVDHWISSQRLTACTDERLSSDERGILCPEIGG